MLTQAENERLTRVGPGTPMGNLLRRYWHPVGCSSMVSSKPQRVRVLGEDLVLYRGESGKPVLMQLRCAHRGVALDYGRVEGDGIRCPYHGWLYDHGGKCVAQPAEENDDGGKIKLTSYRIEEVSGLIFAYLGPDPAPLLPLYDLLVAKGEKSVGVMTFGVNWLQEVENILDVAHFGWLHGYSFPRFTDKKVRYKFERCDYGMNIEMGVDDGPPDVIPFPWPSINRFTLPPAEPGGPLTQVLFFRTPIDDTATENYMVMLRDSDKTPDEEPAFIPAYRIPAPFGQYREHATDWWGIDINDQDRMAAEQQGVIADRTQEHLVASDVGIVQMRRIMREGIEAVERGEDPIGVIRDPAKQKVTFRLYMGVTKEDRQDDVDYSIGMSQSEKV